MRVANPGSRGGKFWVDERGQVRYGQRPTGATRPLPPPQQPHTPPAAEGLADHPSHQEFGAWSKEATKVYLGQALRFAPCITNIIERYLDMVSRYGMGAAAEAFKAMTPEDVPAATVALGRIRRLARWDRYGRVKAEGEGTSIPSIRENDVMSTVRNPFVQAAMRAGMPQDAALLWQQIALRALNRHKQGMSYADLLLSRQPEERALWLAKAVMKPGSRGGHVYWKNGRLHYGIPGPPAHRRATVGPGVKQNPPQGPSPLAVALMRQGRRIQFTDSSGTRAWGEIITATGDMLAVLPDSARPYDLLHTIVVPVDAVLKVTNAESEDDDEMEKSDGETGPIGGLAVDHQPRDRQAEDYSCWPEADE